MNFDFNFNPDGTIATEAPQYNRRGRVPKGERWKADGERISEFPRITCRVPKDKKEFLDKQRLPGETDQSLMNRMVDVLMSLLD